MNDRTKAILVGLLLLTIFLIAAWLDATSPMPPQ